MPVNPLGYPLDLQGNNPANFIVNEIRTFNTAAQRLFVPSAGPFYRMDFEIRNNVTNQLLLPNADYKIVHLHKAAVLISGKNVNAGIYVHNTNIPSVRVSYRVIGGHFADTADVIRQLFLDNPPTDAATIPWDHVFGAPAQMPPVEHLHDMLDTYGYGNLITVLEQLRVAVIAGDGPAIDAIYRYIEILLTNSGFVTAQEVLNMINLDTANQVKVYATYADLRAETLLPNNSDILYITLGKNTRYDGRGRQFVWSIASTDVDDNDKVVKPTIILTNGNGPGRLLSVLNVERDLENSLETLGRKIDNDGVVLTDLAATFPLTVDLDTVVTAGTYWVAPTATNKPAGTTKAHLFVEVSETFVTQTLISIVQNDRNMVGENDSVTAVTTARVFTRNAQFSGGNYLWEDWRGLIDRDTLNIALRSLGRKIDADFKVRSDLVNGTNNTFTGDLNTLILPGPWYVAPTSTNMPIGAERGTVDVLQSGIFISQTFSSIIQEYDITDVSQTVTNGPDTIRPTVFKRILTLNVNLDTVDTVGEWISFVDLPTVNRALKTLGREIETDYTIDTRIAAINHTNGTDLNAVTTPGTHWVDNTCTNRPPNVDNGMLYVESADGNYIFQRMQGGQNATPFTDNTATRTDYTEHVRIGIRSLSTDPFVWTTWESMLTRTRATVNGIDVHLAETNVAGANLDTHVKTGRHWVGEISLNRAFDYGILDVTTLNANDVMQVMHSRANRAVRYGYAGTAYAGHTWTAWFYSEQEVIFNTSNFDATNQSLDACDKVGRHWFGLNNANRPFDHGMVEVVRLVSTELLQIAYSTLDRGNATRTWKNGVGWTPWAYPLDTRISQRHGIDTAIAATNVLPANTDLNTVITPGKHWFSINYDNSPFEHGILEVEMIDATNLIQTAYDGYREAIRRTTSTGASWTDWSFIKNLNIAAESSKANMDLDWALTPGEYYYTPTTISRPTSYGLVKVWRETNDIVYQEAHGADNTKHVRYRANDGTWTRWLKAMDSIEMERHGINTGIVTHYALSPTDDLDLITTPGKYYLGDTQVNRPGDFGILEVELISGTIDSPGEIEQTFKCSLLGVFATRRRYWDGIVHVWDVWRRRALRNGEASQSFAMFSYPINLIDPTHGVNAAFLATQMATLWARLTANGIDAALSVTNDVPHYNDLDDLIVVGKYWIGDTIQNAPFNWAVVEVEMVVAGNIIQTVYDGYRKTTRRTASSGATWSDWHYSIHLNIAAESSKDNMSLDSALTPGEYYYTPNTISRPSPYGLVKVWRETDDIVYQEAHGSDNNKYIRYRSGLGVWTPWLRLANANDLAAIPSYNTEIPFFEDTGPYYWTLPAGVTSIIISLCAGGGGGGQGGGGRGRQSDDDA